MLLHSSVSALRQYVSALHSLQVDKERSSNWVSVIDATVGVLQQQLALNPDTGLLADFLVYDHSEDKYKPAKGKILERESDGDFGYNACRWVQQH